MTHMYKKPYKAQTIKPAKPHDCIVPNLNSIGQAQNYVSDLVRQFPEEGYYKHIRDFLINRINCDICGAMAKFSECWPLVYLCSAHDRELFEFAVRVHGREHVINSDVKECFPNYRMRDDPEWKYAYVPLTDEDD